jgi:hypothetical protein
MIKMKCKLCGDEIKWGDMCMACAEEINDEIAEDKIAMDFYEE